MVNNDDDRYWSMPIATTTYLPFAVWDFEDNTYIAFCGTEEHAGRVAIALNKA